MNTQNAKDYLPLVQALAEGKTIQFFYEEDRWSESTTGIGWKDRADVDFTYSAKYYRVKPEPRTFEMWLDPDTNNMTNVTDEPFPDPDWGWVHITVQEILK